MDLIAHIAAVLFLVLLVGVYLLSVPDSPAAGASCTAALIARSKHPMANNAGAVCRRALGVAYDRCGKNRENHSMRCKAEVRAAMRLIDSMAMPLNWLQFSGRSLTLTDETTRQAILDAMPSCGTGCTLKAELIKR